MILFSIHRYSRENKWIIERKKITDVAITKHGLGSIRARPYHRDKIVVNEFSLYTVTPYAMYNVYTIQYGTT